MACNSRIVFLICIFLRIFGTYGKNYTCIPSEDCANGAAGDKVPDPADCTNYYFCITDTEGSIVPSPAPISCSTGQYFEAANEDCKDETVDGTCDSDYCRDNYVPTSCQSSCVENDYPSLIGDPSDCSTYYLCTGSGDPIQYNCGLSQPYFDGENCVDDPYKCCDFCTPYCTDLGTEVPDPYDCHSFYICTAVGIPSEDEKGKCAVGTHFNASTLNCESPEACSSLCSNSTFFSSSKYVLPSCTSMDDFRCPSQNARYALCTGCDKRYISCEKGVASLKTCEDDKVFNSKGQPLCIDSRFCNI